MSKFRNFKMVDYVIYGRGSFDQLDEILAPQRKEEFPMIFLVDHFFQGKTLPGRIPLRGKDKVIFADVTYEPKTTYVDTIAGELKEEFGTVSGVVGIGGGSAMDLAKAVSLMMTVILHRLTKLFSIPNLQQMYLSTSVFIPAWIATFIA